jgi:hypothetical protein
MSTTLPSVLGIVLRHSVSPAPTRRRSTIEPIRLCGGRPRDTPKAWTALRSSTKSAGPARPSPFGSKLGLGCWQGTRRAPAGPGRRRGTRLPAQPSGPGVGLRADPVDRRGDARQRLVRAGVAARGHRAGGPGGGRVSQTFTWRRSRVEVLTHRGVERETGYKGLIGTLPLPLWPRWARTVRHPPDR